MQTMEDVAKFPTAIFLNNLKEGENFVLFSDFLLQQSRYFECPVFKKTAGGIISPDGKKIILNSCLVIHLVKDSLCEPISAS